MNMMRVPEAELMDDEAQVQAYAHADFEQAHSLVMEHFARRTPHAQDLGAWVDLGCGDGEMTTRLARLCPHACIDALDGSPTMLRYAQQRLVRAQVAEQVRLVEAVLPDMPLDKGAYDGIFSNSLLHHLGEPQHLWQAVAYLGKVNAHIFLCDLYRPPTEQRVNELVEQYAATEPKILQRDFRNSLCAAYTREEIQAQLVEARLTHLNTELISDRHIIIYRAHEGTADAA